MTQNNPVSGTTKNPPAEWLADFSGQFTSKVTTKETTTSSGSTKEVVEEKIPMAVEALKYAHDIRKFEIDLYWKRSAYFQTVIAIVLGALALTLRASEADPSKAWIVSPSTLQAVVMYFGAILSFAWYAATRGGKYWQRNWETQVDTLENLVTGPLYKTVYRKEGKYRFTDFFREYPYSTSKINSLVSLAFLLLFLLSQVFFFFSAVNPAWPIECASIFKMPRLAFVIFFGLSVVTIFIMHRSARFSVRSAAEEDKKRYAIDQVPVKRDFVSRS